MALVLYPVAYRLRYKAADAEMAEFNDMSVKLDPELCFQKFFIASPILYGCSSELSIVASVW